MWPYPPAPASEQIPCMSKRAVCRFFLQGRCTYGPQCRFAHVDTAAAAGNRFGKRDRYGGQSESKTKRKQGPEGAAAASRVWWTSGSPPAQAAPQFRVMSYNVLADELAQSHRLELYRRTPLQHLDWDRRWAMMLQEIAALAPEVVCLQEVDHWEQVEQDMQQLGYQGCYAQRSGGRTDGCATCWSTACFDLLATDQLSFSDYDMRDNVGLLALLVFKQQQLQQQQLPDGMHPAVAVANTHILFNPKRGDMKVGQLRLLLRRLQYLVAAVLPQQADHVPALVMGDMNHQPGTPVYHFMRHGWVDCLRQHRKDMSGGLRGNEGLGRHGRSISQPPPPLPSLLPQQYPQQWLPGNGPPAQLMNEHLHGWQWQQQQASHHQHQQLHRSASAPSLLTIRKLKNAGWSAEELITATGGAHGTHLPHFVQLHHHHEQQQQQQQIMNRQQSGGDWSQRGATSSCEQVQQQQQQQQQHTSALHSESEIDHVSSEHRQRAAGKSGQHAAAYNSGENTAEQELGLAKDRPQSSTLNNSQQQQLQEVSVDAAAAAARQRRDVWSALDKAQRQALKNLRLQGGSVQQVDELIAAQQQERKQLQKQQKSEREQQQPQERAQQLQQSRQQPRQQSPRQQQQQIVATGMSGAVAAAAAGIGRMPPVAAVGQHDVLLPQPWTTSPPASGGQRQPQQPWESQRPPFPTFFSWGRALWDEPLPASLGDGVARHSLQLRSCYAEVTGSEPEYTSCHDSFFGTVDYIWYTPAAGLAQLKPVSVLLPPNPDTHLPGHARSMPNAAIPSDHVCLVANFELLYG